CRLSGCSRPPPRGCRPATSSWTSTADGPVASARTGCSTRSTVCSVWPGSHSRSGTATTTARRPTRRSRCSAPPCSSSSQGARNSSTRVGARTYYEVALRQGGWPSGQRRFGEGDRERAAPYHDAPVLVEIGTGGNRVLLVALVALQRPELDGALVAAGGTVGWDEIHQKVRPVVGLEIRERDHGLTVRLLDDRGRTRARMRGGLELPTCDQAVLIRLGGVRGRRHRGRRHNLFIDGV